MKKIKRPLSDAETRDMLRYYAHCQSLRDFIDEKVIASGMYFQIIKGLTNQLVDALEKQVDFLMKIEDDKSEGEILEQFINASIQGDYLFEVALKIENLDRDKKIECATKLADILKEYGIK